MEQQKKKPSNQPVLLMKNVRYPTYQLHGTAGQGKDPETVLKIVVLQTMDWLRQRFREHDLPGELNLPDASHFESVDFEQFKSFHLNLGYKLDVIWLEEARLWAMQLTEPDLGPSPGEKELDRAPVPGRLFETNISFQIVQNAVRFGVQTIVSDPEGTKDPCEVFRLAIIKQLVRNPNVRLTQTWTLQEKPYALKEVSEIKAFKKKQRDSIRTMPIIVFAEYAAEPEKKPQPAIGAMLPPIDLSAKRPLGMSTLPSLLDKPPAVNETEPKNHEQREKIENLAASGIGFAHLFILSAERIDEFKKQTGINLKSGGAVIIHPDSLRLPDKIYSPKEVAAEGFYKELKAMVKTYPKKKMLDFSFINFVHEARALELAEISNKFTTKEEVIAAYEEKLENIKDEYENKLLDSERRLKKEADSSWKSLDGMRERNDDLAEELRVLKGLNSRLEIELKKMKIRRDSFTARPKKLSDVCDWGERFFSEQILFHERAKKIMAKADANKNDLRDICDALEYLAIEYRSELTGEITKAERDSQCSEHYGRPFDVTPINNETIKEFPDEYTIDYRGNSNTPLNLHLRVGVDTQNLLRIYFFYDKEKKLIVIGSMPEHLSTRSYS